VRVGYTRVSRKDQRLEPQCDALLADSSERDFEEKVSSREADRKALREAFDYCREGDVLVVARLDRETTLEVRDEHEPGDYLCVAIQAYDSEGNMVMIKNPKPTKIFRIVDLGNKDDHKMEFLGWGEG
jgi:hypothetical protein